MLNFIYRFLIIFLLTSPFAPLKAQTQKTSPVLVSENPKTFLNELNSNSISGRGYGTMSIPISSTKALELRMNVKDETTKTHAYIGSVANTTGSSFRFTYTNGKLEGHIIEQNEEKAFRLFTGSSQKVFIEETDINAILCISFDKAAGTASKISGKTLSSQGSAMTLQSRPEATAVVYLDFDGETVSGTSWNNGNTITATSAGFSEAEIRTTWQIMAEDFSPFDVNIVTDRTVFEATPMNRRMMCIFTATDTAQPGSGGVAYLNSFSWNSNDPCWVYNISNGKHAGDTGSHEVGHTMGLEHDGKGTTEYYSGHGNWAPIMGFSLNKPIAQWSLGEYSNASNTQNDIQTIAGVRNNFGFVPDDHGDALNTATEIDADAGGIVRGTSNSGIIRERDDIDIFSFLAQAGEANFTFSPDEAHPNLDIQVRLLNEGGTEVASSNPAGVAASITTPIAAGLYYLEIQGTGAGSVDNGYSDYASLGQYTISGQYTVQTPENDLKLLSITPLEGDFICGSIAPVLTLLNNGQNTISNFDIRYRINQGNQEIQSFSTTLAAQESGTFTLDPITLTSTGETTIEIIAQITSDNLPNNNSLETRFYANVSGVAAQENSFETSDDALIAYDGSAENSIWERGVPNGGTLNSAHTGTNAYGTILSGNYPASRLSYLVSNCYDFSSIENPVLKFEMAYDLENNYDVLYVQYSTDTGATWSLLGSASSQPNWYSSNRTNASSGGANDCQNCPGGQWTGRSTQFSTYSYDFQANAATDTDLSDADTIMFRFVFHSDELFNREGVVIDDFLIEGTPADTDDDDNDGILDVDDNCPLTSNADQLNTDGDAFGDSCDDDDDNDGILDADDNCPLTSNPDQADTDGDGIGDVCEDPNDFDGDGIPNLEDNCPEIANENQEDYDDDTIGDSCDPDDDNDGILDSVDNCSLYFNPNQLDTDSDGIGDECDKDDDNDGILDEDDNCPLTANPNQEDRDNDGIGDVCDSTADDLDNDGILNEDDNCQNTPNADQLDSDGDGIGDVCDPDDDNDTILDIVDNCPLEPNTDQADSDNDGIGDICDGGFSLADSNYEFTVLGSCVAGKGSLKIEVAEDFRYQATLSKDAIGLSKDFSTSVTFDDLEAGQYTVCITVDGQSNYVACFDIDIIASELFSVVTELNPNTNIVTLFLTGSEAYTVTLNDTMQTVSENEVTLVLTEPKSELVVTSGNDCDEPYQETLVLLPEVYVYPNPVEGDELTIQLDGGLETELVVSLFTVRGTRVSSRLYEVGNNEVTIAMSGLAKGLYILSVSSSTTVETYKILRK